MTPLLLPRFFRSICAKSIFVLCILIAGKTWAQPGIEYDRVLDITGFAVLTADGGYLAGDDNNNDYHIVKYNAAGKREWEKYYRANREDRIKKIIPTADGGYLLGGISRSEKGGHKTEECFYSGNPFYAHYDYWVIKITSNGTKQWDKTLGGIGVETLTSLLQTTDGGYLIGGNSVSPASGIKSKSSVSTMGDYWVVKLAADGTFQWENTTGGNDSENLVGMKQAADGGYYLAGSCRSLAGGDKTAANRGINDYWVVKLTAAGAKEWDRAFGGDNDDVLSAFEATSDGGFLLGGTSRSAASGEKTGKHFGRTDYWVVKVSAAFDKIWDRTLGGSKEDELGAIKETSDGRYVIMGKSMSEADGARHVPREGIIDAWLIKVNADGSTVWEKSVNAYSSLPELYALPEGGFMIHNVYATPGASGDKTTYSAGISQIKLLPESNTRKLSFSNASISFTSTGNVVMPASQAVTLTASTGTPATSLYKSPTETWLTIPQSGTGRLQFSASGNDLAPDNYQGIVAATAPGYERALLDVKLLVVSLSQPEMDPIGDKSLFVGQTLTFTAKAYARVGQSKVFSLEGAPAGATINARTGAFKWTPASTGVYKFRVRVTANTAPLVFNEEEITVTVSNETANNLVRINAGGGAYTTADGREFMADQYFNGVDRTSTNDTVDIQNTTDDELYRSGRAATSFGYAIPIRNGMVKVTLHFAEIYWGVFPGRPALKGRRRFGVSAEGVSVLDNYDIIVEAGGTLRAVQETFEVPVSDGILNLNFGARNDAARVSAIEVERIDPLSTVTLAPVADAFVRKSSFINTNYGSEPSLECKTGSRDDHYRASFLKFSLAALSQVTTAKLRVYGYNYEGNYTVRLSVKGVESDAWTENGINGANAPAATGTALGYFEVTRQGRQYFEVDVTDFIRAQVGTDKIATLMMEGGTVNGERIIFNSRENATNRPELVITTTGPVVSGARIAEVWSAVEESKAESSVIFPNPVRKQISIQLSNQHHDNISLSLINAAGHIYPLQTREKLSGGAKAEADISYLSLAKGIYILKVQSDNASEVLKVMVAE